MRKLFKGTGVCARSYGLQSGRSCCKKVFHAAGFSAGLILCVLVQVVYKLGRQFKFQAYNLDPETKVGANAQGREAPGSSECST